MKFRIPSGRVSSPCRLSTPQLEVTMVGVRFVDTTLRDGEQAPGVAFNLQEKVTIARMLDRLGVAQIEAGTPAMGEVEQQAIAAIVRLGLRSRVSTWNRVVPADIRASLACGVRHVHISAPVSDIQIKYKLGRNRRWVLQRLKRTCFFAAEHGLPVTVGAEDASRADPEFLLEFASPGPGAGRGAAAVLRHRGRPGPVYHL